MAGIKEYERLKKSFSISRSLPALPGTGLKLIQVLECEDTASIEVERIIVGDPGLTAAVLRAASSALFGGQSDNATTVRGAVARLGHRALHSVAVSMVLQDLMLQAGSSPSFDRVRFARHSLFVGMMARYLFAARSHRKSFTSKWSRDELFAAGMLHDLGLGLLTRVSKEDFEHVHMVARARSLSLQQGFEYVFGVPIYELGALACETWKLPPLFAEILRAYPEPLSHEADSVGLCCLAYANQLADENGFDLVAWAPPVAVDPAIVEEVGLPEADLANVVMLVSRHTTAFVSITQAA